MKQKTEDIKNKKIFLYIITIALFIGLGFIVFKQNNSSNSNNQNLQNVQVVEGVQYITINAGKGYFPRISEAKAGIPTKLIIKTNGVYDCSLALVIRSINFQKLLSNKGEEVIDIGVPVSGVPLTGTCSMGMYNFTINFL